MKFNSPQFTMPKKYSSIIQRLQIVFSISIGLLVISLIASVYSTNGLIENSKLVNHTNEVLRQSEMVISYMKDAETGQRGFLVTKEPSFLQPYNGAYEKVMNALHNVKDKTTDNPVQQKNIEEAKALIDAKFDQMKRTIDISTKRSGLEQEDVDARLTEMRSGKKMMDDLRAVVERIKTEEKRLLDIRSQEQVRYISYTPVLVIVAALISILITVLSYIRIKADMEQRLAEQLKEEQKYIETAQRIAVIENMTQLVSEGDYSIRSEDKGDDELGKVAKALNKMTVSLESSFNELLYKDWIKEGTVIIGDAIRGERDIRKLSEKIIQSITEYINAPIGAMYVINKSMEFVLTGSYAAVDLPKTVKVGEGLIGEALKKRKMVVLDDLPADYLKVSSSLVEGKIAAVIVLPLAYDNESIGVIEIGLLRKPSAKELEWLSLNLEAISIGLNAVLSYERLQELFEEMQAQTEELQAQHNELESLNTELEAQSQKLQASEEELKVQQEELQQTNGELEERTLLLEERNLEIQKKAEELQQSTKYKSEFLANMSHELRTPLNSILLLSRLLSENNETNLSTDQIEYARVIQSSGQGLLGLIDEILDLSKIEAGKMQVEYLDVPMEEIVEEMKGLFKAIAAEKKLNFDIRIEQNVPKVIETDKVRLSQILKNLLSNALKFTSKGFVEMVVNRFPTNDNILCFTVRDSGIGIPAEKQHQIFEAFQQADGSTRRKYGGTGLGLSISRELVKLLGGELKVISEVNKGSEFTIYIPLVKPQLNSIAYDEQRTAQRENTPHKKEENEVNQYLSAVIPNNIPDDRRIVKEGDKIILIIEDDVLFASALLKYTQSQGYKGIVAVRGDEGLQLAQSYKPTGILLDLQLPIKSGWQIMDELKANPMTRHIPVHIMSSHSMKNESLRKGAIDFINKPFILDNMQEIFKKIESVLNRNPKKVLIVEENSMHAKALAYFLEANKIHSEVKSDIKESVSALTDKEVDCVILDMGIPDLKAYEMLEEAKKNPGLENLPIIVFTGKSLSIGEEQRIKQYADSIIVKTAHSYQRMLDEISLFLHLVEENKQKSDKPGEVRSLGALNQVLNGKTVLVADDDVRNIFSLSKALEKFKMNVITAIDGKEALRKLEEHPAIDVVLLDMMMPQMDGYETARRIRSEFRWKKLPVIAVTAKAMTGDREKCINAGASDYITKPVDIDQLLSLLRVWLYEKA
jgi:signal transduction histidine kinase/DNA-binding response OmpR family regulator/CHASE3 domain sensor protein